jgi:hypothetical protein
LRENHGASIARPDGPGAWRRHLLRFDRGAVAFTTGDAKPFEGRIGEWHGGPVQFCVLHGGEVRLRNVRIRRLAPPRK